MSKKMRANLMLLVTAIIWGSAFVAQDVAADVIEPLTFNAIRMAFAAIAMLPSVWLMDRGAARAGTGMDWRHMNTEGRKNLLIGGAACGTMLALGSACQQLGMTMGTGAGKAGFITALYIVLVPLLGLFRHKKVGRMVWLAVALSVAGLYFLCVQGSFTITAADGVLMLCALCYAGHILVVDHYSRRTECVKLSCLQFAVTSLLCALGALLTEHPTWEAVNACIFPLLYAGVLSGALGYTLQTLAQRDAEPTVASLLMSLESVFAVLTGWIILGDALSLRELLGCVLMMGGIVLAQLPQKEQKGE